ncbi:MAG: MgtC/SapB family protein [Candidatus Izemoplasmatales bacterium]|jgi:putative Mg2+ transporter-C (MgtC) family protein|nr:MgtC/SapB family protein [Candidatus Izemoplasmatales bacterium]
MFLSFITNFLENGPGIVEIITRMLLTAVFVGVIGLERQMRHKIAGVTTHLMVAFGAAGIAILQDALYYDAIATTQALYDNVGYYIEIQIQRQRVIAQVVTGVGFLGAGTILKTRNGIYGLTTAATLWLAAMIGLTFGMGAYVIGAVISIFSLIFLTFFRKILGKTSLKHQESPEIIGSQPVDE